MDNESLSRDRYAREHGLPTDAELHDLKVAATERARVRQLALAHAERWLADGSEFAAQALRELADELEDH